VENKKMEDERKEEKKWEKIRIEKKIREDLTRLRIISSHFASDLISEGELQTMIQLEISKLCLVATTTDLVYQGEVAIINENYQKEVSRKELVKRIKEINELDLIRIIVKVFKDRKQKYWEQEAKKNKNNTTIEAKQMSLFFCLKF
jgi:hypothetical protein